MTIRVYIYNMESQKSDHVIEVQKVSENPDGSFYVEDGVRLGPGEHEEFTIWGTTRLAVSEVTRVVEPDEGADVLGNEE